MAEKFNVTGEQYFGITGQVLEIIKQLRQNGGSPIDPKLVKIALQEIVEGKFKTAPLLRLISGRGKLLLIKASDGQAVIAKAEETFKSYIDPDFWYLDVPAEATEETFVDVYEMMMDGNFFQLFSSLNADLDKLVMTQSQIIDFCKYHPAWLHQGVDNTFFLIKKKRSYFAVYASMNVRGLGVHVEHVRKRGKGWDGASRHRLVVPRVA